MNELISPNDKVGNKKDSDKSLYLLVSLMLKQEFKDIITYPKNSYEQVQLGIDLKFKNWGKVYSADHKSRSPKWGHKGLFALEFANNAGQTGSLFKGTQDFFILEGSKSFVFFDPKDLIKLFLDKVNINQVPLISGSKESFENNIPKLYTLITRSNYLREWDKKPNEDEFAWFTYQEVVHLIKYTILK